MISYTNSKIAVSNGQARNDKEMAWHEDQYGQNQNDENLDDDE